MIVFEYLSGIGDSDGSIINITTDFCHLKPIWFEFSTFFLTGRNWIQCVPRIRSVLAPTLVSVGLPACLPGSASAILDV